MSEITIRLADGDEIWQRWAEIEPILRRATDRSHGCYLPKDVYDEAARGQLGIVLIEEAPDPKTGGVALFQPKAAGSSHHESPAECGTTPFQQGGNNIIGVAAIEPKTCPRRALLNIPWFAGERIEEWIEAFTATVDRIAQERGISLITTQGGRDGWHRMLRRQGIAVAATGTVVYREV